MITAGIDAGSRAIKVVIYDSTTDRVVAAAVCDQGVRQEMLAREACRKAFRQAGLRRTDICRTVATGYGRNLLGFADTTITEITCHARGVRRHIPHVRTIIEIGGQDSKVIRLSADGTVRDFAMNDRCAAGTGRFLEVVANRMEVPLEHLCTLSARSECPAAISSMCVVFAETEIVGLMAGGTKPEDIVAGVQTGVVKRVASMAGRGFEELIVFTGGVAMLPGMAQTLALQMGQPVAVAPDPQFTGALGAALLAAER